MNQLFLILQVCKSQDLQHNFYDDSKKTSVLRRFLEKIIALYGANALVGIYNKFKDYINIINTILIDTDRGLNNLIIWSCPNHYTIVILILDENRNEFKQLLRMW